jgi:hypothetical protein
MHKSLKANKFESGNFFTDWVEHKVRTLQLMKPLCDWQALGRNRGASQWRHLHLGAFKSIIKAPTYLFSLDEWDREQDTRYTIRIYQFKRLWYSTADPKVPAPSESCNKNAVQYMFKAISREEKINKRKELSPECTPQVATSYISLHPLHHKLLCQTTPSNSRVNQQYLIKHSILVAAV